MANERITDYKCSMQDIMLALSETNKGEGHNPGAISVIMNILKNGSSIDPYCPPLMYLLHLDGLNIYGSHIWMLYKDVCRENLNDTLMVIRAKLCGFITQDQVHHAIQSYGEGLDLPDLRKKVQERLPNFKIKE